MVEKCKGRCLPALPAEKRDAFGGKSGFMNSWSGAIPSRAAPTSGFLRVTGFLSALTLDGTLHSVVRHLPERAILNISIDGKSRHSKPPQRVITHDYTQESQWISCYGSDRYRCRLRDPHPRREWPRLTHRRALLAKGCQRANYSLWTSVIIVQQKAI